ncbi:ferrodoxin-NADP(+) reductase [Phanerochaete sordida]|uniref:Ferrodoxin-NADP(+) reductase n=1 Tax=Phanerochaete sordida TaxID=48140 RepID=A0A9P3GH19_9APHY|nr:ferrodoxin-NADP(+) reductase [Phanerochaete sordida]
MVVPILKVAILGSGPSAFYAAARILAVLPKTPVLQNAVRIHMYDRLWAPHGLVRYGVAPDHPEVKNCMNKFHEVASDPRVSFFGNVDVLPPPPEFLASATSLNSSMDGVEDEQSSEKNAGQRTRTTEWSFAGVNRKSASPFRLMPDGLHWIKENGDLLAGDGRYMIHPNPPKANAIRLDKLFPYYTHLVIASGAPVPVLHPALPPVDHKIIPALDMVHWYTHHPSATESITHYAMPPTIPKHVTIIGNGNVALDCARILLSDPARLRPYGLPAHVQAALEQSTLEHVAIVGRRGPRDAAFTTKELREMMNLDGVAFTGLRPEVLAAVDADARPLLRQHKRVLDVLRAGSACKPGGPGVRRTWSLEFWRAPVGAAAADARALAYDSPGHILLALAETRAVLKDGVPTGRVRTTDNIAIERTDLVVTALGQRATPETTPFCDPALGHIRTAGGSFTHPDAAAGQGAADATAARTPESAPAAGSTATTSPLADADAASEESAQKPKEEPPILGQVLHPLSGAPLRNIFAAGWAARGAKGVLGTTMLDAHTVGEALVADWLRGLREEEYKTEDAAAAADAKAGGEGEGAGAGAGEGAARGPKDLPPSLAQIYGVPTSPLPRMLGPTTVPRRLLNGLYARPSRARAAAVTYPEFMELAAREAGGAVRFGWREVADFLLRSDGVQKWFAHLKGEMPYQQREGQEQSMKAPEAKKEE